MPAKHSFLDNFKKLLLKSSFQGLLSKNHLLIRMTDPYSGKSIVKALPYHKETHIIRVPVGKNDKQWQKFADGYPLEVFLEGKYHYGWGELVNQPFETEKEWAALLETQPDIISGLSPNIKWNPSDTVQELTSSFDLLRIEIS
jgi:hypothetical protein